MKYDFITIGGACEDISIWTDEAVVVKNRKDKLKEKLLGFEYGAKVKVKKFLSTPGGGADNAAVALSRLGFKTAILAALGDDARGKKIIKNLKKERVDTRLIEVVKKTESGFSPGIVGKDNEHIFFPVRGANERLKIRPEDKKIFKQAKWLYLTSLSGNWEPELKKIFSTRGVHPVKFPYSRGAVKPQFNRVKIAWNPGGRQLGAGAKKIIKYIKNAFVLILNLAEAKGLVSSGIANRNKTAGWFNDPKNLAKAISAWGPKIVVITLGSEGAFAYDGKTSYRQPAIKPKKYVNTIGVGDAFGSTFVAGLELFGGRVKPALKAAAKNSSSVVEVYGAQTGLLKRGQLLK